VSLGSTSRRSRDQPGGISTDAGVEADATRHILYVAPIRSQRTAHSLMNEILVAGSRSAAYLISYEDSTVVTPKGISSECSGA